jgi:hypothetical protein
MKRRENPSLYFNGSFLLRGELCGLLAQQSLRSSKMNILNEKIDFQHSTNFEFLSRI